MNRSFTSIKGMDVVAYGDAGTVLGSICNLVIHPKDFRILGYVVRSGWGMMGYKNHIVLAGDVNKIGILFTINDHRSLLSFDDVIAINSIMESTGYILGKNIVATTKQTLGSCGDLIIDTSYHQLRAIVPVFLFKKRNPLPVAAIKNTTKKAIVVNYQTPIKQSEKIEQLSLLVER